MRHMYMSWCIAMGLALSAACGHTPSPEAGRTVRTVEISDEVKPQVMYASPGEEVRWMNARANAIRVGFLDLRLIENPQCESGIVNVFGQVNDLVTIAPGESISVCFNRTGDLRYNVWFDAEDPRGLISPTFTISVRGG
jgi:plastocyanin